MSAGDDHAALVLAQVTALTRGGAKSLATRGRADLRVREEAEDWLKKGLDSYHRRRFGDALACFERGITTRAKAFRRTTPKRLFGFAGLRSRATQVLKTTSGMPTTRAKAYRKTSLKQRHGSVRHPSEGSGMRNTVLVSFTLLAMV